MNSWAAQPQKMLDKIKRWGPTATLVLPGDAPEADWQAARRKGVTASEIAALMGLSNWQTPFALYHYKLGNLPEQDDNLSMAVGRHFEGFVADLFAGQHPEFFWIFDDTGRDLYAHRDRPWQMATPDRTLYEVRSDQESGLVPYPAAVLECKTDGGYDGWGEDGSDEIPVKYRCQVLWQCDVLGVTAWYVACLFTHSRKLRVYAGEIDDQAQADLKLMRGEAEMFLDRIERQDEPPVDWRPPTATALKHLHPDLEDRTAEVTMSLASQYRRACAAYKRAEERKKLAENRIRHAAGPAARIADKRGDVVAQHQIYEVKAHARKASRVDKLVPAKVKPAKEISTP